MKKNAKRALLLSLSLVIAFGAFAGCTNNSGNTSQSGSVNSSNSSVGSSVGNSSENSVNSSVDSSPVNSSSTEEKGPYDDYEEWYPETLKSNGESLNTYKIVVAADAGASINYAAECLQAELKEATSIEVPIITDAAPENVNEILIGNTSRSEDDDVDFAVLGKESFIIKSVGNDLVIAGNERGSIYGVYDYLEALGFRYYTPDVKSTPDAKKVFVAKDVDRSWTPVFEHREQIFESSMENLEHNSSVTGEGVTAWAVSQRINSDFMRPSLKSNDKFGGFSGYIGGGAMMVHTAQYLMPRNEYYASNPEYFAEGGEEPCLTNEEGLDIIYENMLKYIESDPKAPIISVSMNDIGDAYCKCERCQAQYDEYGISGTFYRAINKLAARLKVDYPEIKVDTLSYAYAKEPPTDLVMEDNVIVRVCLTLCRWHTDPDECHALHPEGSRTLKTEQERLIGWQGIASELYMWYYGINWSEIFSIEPTYTALYNNMQFFVENNITGMYLECYSRENPEFGELKSYLHAKLMATPTMSYGEYMYHMHDFMEGYYGSGWESLLEYIDRTNEIILQMMEDEKYHLAHWYNLVDNIPIPYDYAAGSYDMTMINEFNALWDEAEEYATPEQLLRVKKSRVHWTFIELYRTWDKRYTNGTAEEKATLRARSEALYNDILRFGITQRYDNSRHINDGITNFTRSPALWWR